MEAGGESGAAARPPTPGGVAGDLGSEDVALVAAMARGDNRALAALYDRYGGLLLAIGTRMLGRPKDAEDLLHDVFLEAWRRSADYDPARGTVRAWLSTRMRSRALDRIRSAGRVSNVPLEAAPPAEVSAGEDPDGADRVAVRAALAALPEEQRIVLELAYYAGMSSSEVAERLGVPIGTVKSRTAAALRKLRGVLSDEEESS